MEKLSAAIQKARNQRMTKTKKSSADQFVFKKEEQPSRVDHEDYAGALAQLRPNSFQNWKRAKRGSIYVANGMETAPFDLLRTRVIQQTRENNWKRVAVVSAKSGSGKTTVTANLTFSLSKQEDIRSMVLDFDLRRSALCQAFEDKPDGSFADVLRGIVPFEDFGYRINNNVALGLSRGSIERSSEVLQSNRALAVLKELEAQYDPQITVLDMPPLFQTDDTYGFLSNADCALIVAEAGKTSIKQVDLVEKQVSELTNVLGVVLNKCRYNDSDFTNDYNYYY